MENGGHCFFCFWLGYTQNFFFVGYRSVRLHGWSAELLAKLWCLVGGVQLFMEKYPMQIHRDRQNIYRRHSQREYGKCQQERLIAYRFWSSDWREHTIRHMFDWLIGNILNWPEERTMLKIRACCRLVNRMHSTDS